MRYTQQRVAFPGDVDLEHAPTTSPQCVRVVVLARAFQGANQELRAWYRDRINGTGTLVYAHGKRPVDRRLQEHRRRLKKQTTPKFSFQPYIPGTPPVPFDLRLGLTIEGSTSSLDIDGQLDAKTAPFDTPDHFALTIAGAFLRNARVFACVGSLTVGGYCLRSRRDVV